jgi:homoserine O-acetyltransferase/O-succinyltransferase
MNAGFRWKLVLMTLAGLVAQAAYGFDGSVVKRTHTMPSYTTVGGKTLHDVRIGYESYGKLNDRADNAILVTHFFSGTSHAAGRYSSEDKLPGYWDAIIGAGKALDTEKYFVISIDSLVNVNKEPAAISTGPASINPSTGKPYGMSYPIVTIRDFVNVQEAVLNALGINHLKAVIGASMGSMQALEWASAFPEKTERVIAVIPNDIEASAYLIQALNSWAAPIMLDPKWNGGDYYGREEPIDGITLALKGILLSARHYGWADKTFGRKWAAPDKDPYQALGNLFAIEDSFEKANRARAATIDANSLLYLVKANQLYSLGSGSPEGNIANMKAKALFVIAKSDLLLFPDYARHAMDVLKKQGVSVESFELEGDGGHLEGVVGIAKAASSIRDFLDR